MYDLSTILNPHSHMARVGGWGGRFWAVHAMELYCKFAISRSPIAPASVSQKSRCVTSAKSCTVTSTVDLLYSSPFFSAETPPAFGTERGRFSTLGAACIRGIHCPLAMLVVHGLTLCVAGRSAGFVERKLMHAARYGRADDALRLLDELVAGGERISSTKAHNNAAAACARAGRYAEAISLLDRLRERGGKWDAHSYSTAVTAHGKQGEWERSLDLLRSMERAAASPEGATSSSDTGGADAADGSTNTPAKHPAPNEFVYGAAIGACANAGRWEESLQLLEQMAERGLPPTIRCYNGALSACDKARQPEAAYTLVMAMHASGRKRNRPDAYSYSTALAALGRRPSAAASNQVREVLAAMHDDGVKPNEFVYGTAAMAYGASGSWEHALELIAQMDAQGDVTPSPKLMCNVLNACAVGGAWQSALALVKGMEQRYGVVPDVACVNAAIKACARGSPPQPMLALELLASLGTRSTQRSFSTTLSALANGGKWQEALYLLERMRQIGMEPSLRCVTAAISSCARHGKWQQALSLWRAALASPSIQVDTPCVAAVVDVCAAAGMWRPALRVINDLSEQGLVPTMTAASAEAAMAAQQRGQLEQAPVESKGAQDATADTFGEITLEEETDGEEATAAPPSMGGDPAAVGLTARELNAQLSTVLRLHDQLKREGTLRGEISFEAAIVACERWGLGERLSMVLTRLSDEGKYRLP